MASSKANSIETRDTSFLSYYKGKMVIVIIVAKAINIVIIRLSNSTITTFIKKNLVAGLYSYRKVADVIAY